MIRKTFPLNPFHFPGERGRREIWQLNLQGTRKVGSWKFPTGHLLQHKEPGKNIKNTRLQVESNMYI